MATRWCSLSVASANGLPNRSTRQVGGLASLTITYHAKPITGGYAEWLAAAGVSNTHGPIVRPTADFDGDG
jgi:hypothetical protein